MQLCTSSRSKGSGKAALTTNFIIGRDHKQARTQRPASQEAGTALTPIKTRFLQCSVYFEEPTIIHLIHHHYNYISFVFLHNELL